MEIAQRYHAPITQLLLWGAIACSILLLPFTSFALVRTYYSAPPSPFEEEFQSEIPEKFDAKYQETRCYQVLTIRNYQEAQEQWEAPCACTANIAVLAEVEYEHLLERYNSPVSEGHGVSAVRFLPYFSTDQRSGSSASHTQNKISKDGSRTMLAPAWAR